MIPEWPRDIVAAPDDLPRGDMEPMAAIHRQRDDVWVEGVGTIERLLRDDTKRPRHERFIVRLTPEYTLLFAHNIDLAPRVPLKPGQSIRFRGKFEWTREGGTVHWTHRDRRDRKAGGWIIANGQLYR